MKKQLFFFMLVSASVHAQDRTVSTGGEYTASSGTISFTVGIPDHEQLTQTSGAISQGVQQPYELFVNAVEEWDFSIPIEIFPNPTSSSFSIKLGDLDKSNLSYKIIDFSGKLILEGTINQVETLIDIEQLARASYLLQINKESQMIRSYKIIKN